MRPADASILLGLLEPLFTIHEVARLGTAAAHVCVKVLEHLAEEEGPNGLFTTIEKEAPRLGPRVAELRNEHDDLRILTNSAFRYASLNAPASVQHATLESLWIAVAEHSARERDALQEALLVDLGGESGLSDG
jgi:hypothetical protein